MTTIEHPKYPLQDEERIENEEELKTGTLTSAQVLDRRVSFNKRRDAEFPGWKERYDSEIEEWLVATGQKRKPRAKREKTDAVVVPE